MSFLDGIGGSIISDLAEVGIGALTGGVGSLLEEAVSTVMQTAISQGLQQVGQDLGLSSDEISSALSSAGLPTSGSAADVAASYSQQMGASPMEQGSTAQTAQQATDAITQMMQQGVEQSGQAEGKVSGGKGMSLLQAIAYAMGKAMDSKLDDMSQKAQQLGNSQSGSSQYGQLSSEIQADGQELGMMSSAVSNALKSIGDAGTTLAKKD